MFCSKITCVHQEQLKVIHQAQIESLEAQVISLRSVYWSNCEANVANNYSFFLSFFFFLKNKRAKLISFPAP